MTLIAEVGVPGDTFPLGAVLAGAAAGEVQVARALRTGTGVVGYFWVEYADLVDIERSLRDAPPVRSFGVVDTVDGEAQFRVERAPRETGFLEELWRADGALLDGLVDGDGWTVRVGFDSTADRTAFLEAFDGAGRVDGTLDVTDPTGQTEAFGVTEAALHRAGLTLVQRETLRCALEAGYFDVPRGITLSDIAREKEVSDNAVSQRLRRGLQTVLREVLEEPEGSASEGAVSEESASEGSASEGAASESDRAS